MHTVGQLEYFGIALKQINCVHNKRKTKYSSLLNIWENHMQKEKFKIEVNLSFFFFEKEIEAQYPHFLH